MEQNFEDLTRELYRMFEEVSGEPLSRFRKRQYFKKIHKKLGGQYGMREIADYCKELEIKEKRSLTSTNRALNQVIRSVTSVEEQIKKGKSSILIAGKYLVDNGIDEQVLQAGGLITSERITSTTMLPSRYFEDVETGKVMIEITYMSRDKIKKTIVPLSQIAIASEFLKLSDLGIDVNAVNVKKLIAFFSAALDEFKDDIPLVYIVTKGGWLDHDDKKYFVIGNNVFPKTAMIQRKILPEDQSVVNKIKNSGSYDAWVLSINWLMQFPIARFYLGAFLASPLLRYMNCPNFIVHIFNNSTTGKTTLMTGALSFVGQPTEDGLRLGWSVTTNGPEARALQFNDVGAPFDDSTLLDPEMIREIIYRLTNGSGKQRANKSGEARPVNSYKLVAISTGESPLQTTSSRQGELVRVIEISSPPFEKVLNASEDIERFSEILSMNYGHGLSYYEAIAEMMNDPTSKKRLEERYNEIKHNLVDGISNKYVKRMNSYFAISTLALDILSEVFPELSLTREENLEAARLVMQQQLEKVKAKEDIDVRAYKYCIEYYLRHKADLNSSGWCNKISRRDQPSNSGIAFVPSKLEEILKEGGYDFYASVKFFKDNGWLWLKDGHLWPTTFNNLTIRAYVLDYKKAEKLGIIIN